MVSMATIRSNLPKLGPVLFIFTSTLNPEALSFNLVTYYFMTAVWKGCMDMTINGMEWKKNVLNESLDWTHTERKNKKTLLINTIYT